MSVTKPHVELRKVHESRALSEETPAYSAQIWVDALGDSNPPHMAEVIGRAIVAANT